VSNYAKSERSQGDGLCVDCAKKIYSEECARGYCDRCGKLADAMHLVFYESQLRNRRRKKNRWSRMCGGNGNWEYNFTQAVFGTLTKYDYKAAKKEVKA